MIFHLTGVTVLEKMAVAAMPKIIRHRIASQKPAHHGRYLRGAGSQQQVEVIWNQRPGKAGGLGFRKDISKSI